MATYLQRAFSSLGLAPIAGFVMGDLIGYSEMTASIDPSAETRSSSETSYLQESIVSTYLPVYPQTFVERILFDKNKTATEVNVSTAGMQYYLTTRKEVILSAGVVGNTHHCSSTSTKLY